MENARITTHCRGIRGATTADANTREAILEATRDMLVCLIEANDLCVFECGLVSVLL